MNTELKVDRRLLIDALNKVVPGLTTEEVLEQSDCFVFQNGRIMTYNDEVCASVPFQFGGWNGAVKSQKLLQILNKMEAAEIKITITDNEVRISSSKSRLGIPAQQAVTLPVQEVRPPEENSDQWKDVPQDFTTALRFCMFSTAKDGKSEPVLNCIHISGDYAESCDDSRSTRYKMSGKMEHDLCIPRNTAVELSKLVITKVAVDASFIHFLTEDKVVFSRRKTCSGYPDLSGFFEVQGTEMILPETLGETLMRAGIFSSDNDNNYVEIVVASGVMTVTGKGNGGWFQERDKVHFPEDIRFFINPTFFKEALSVMQSILVADNRICMNGERFSHAVCLTTQE